ncbi:MULTISPECIES: glycoside hydrolase family 15 protein [Kosmotoga]|uniref:Glycoside hydrolase 15-related n=1 Tax=Kosmotoga olearia (strain ATCC BAA-1733 / DSM 21960 / TBF 19.5.1) TaxID=521045 RepID=C5CH56_KOSOT|nr:MULTISPECIES: glycoside hydrolase family 15 protein [Kosmotoga]ACR80659.1 glycoside hydrolase 15-related [Kosmotoga olearia TBF 19.5.1]
MNKLSRSIKIIEKHQSPQGAYIASPNFSQYGYCWFRDGSFVAATMARAGKVESAEKFFRWGFQVIADQKPRIEKLLTTPGELITHKDLLPTRYNLNGTLTQDDWPNGQSDGYGTFLWALGKYAPSEFIKENLELIELVVRYLEKVWKIPCYDVWEENPDGIHTSTLLSIAAGLKAAERILHKETGWVEIVNFIERKLVKDGRLRKSTLSDDVDASLIWGAVPFELFSIDDQLVVNTVKAIDEKLYINGGVKRYSADTYFGGGSWILLASNLGQYYAKTGEREKAEFIKEWVEFHFDAEGLPEQVPEFLIDERKYSEWVNQWGEIAKPLLWSHANYMELLLDLKGKA